VSGGRAEEFARRKAPEWRAFRAAAAEYASKGTVPAARAVPFARAYRDVAADLSAARAMGAPRDVLFELNSLVALGHSVVYRRRVGPRGPSLLEVPRFLLSGFPALLLRHRRPFALALALFFVPAGLGYWFVATTPGGIHAVFPSLSGVISPGGRDEGGAINPMPAALTSFYWVNNTLATLFCFAGGVAAGLGTAYVLGVNGMILGALAAHFASQEALARFWPQVLPHGITELLGIFVSATAGLIVGNAVWRPGPWSRRDALVVAGRDAMLLVAGAVFLIVVSGVIESYFTRSTDDDAVRNVFAAAAGVAVLAWLGAAWGHRSATGAASPSAPGSGSPPPG